MTFKMVMLSSILLALLSLKMNRVNVYRGVEFSGNGFNRHRLV